RPSSRVLLQRRPPAPLDTLSLHDALPIFHRHAVTCSLTYDLVVSWDAELSALTERIARPMFTRPEPRSTFGDLVRALLADVPRRSEEHTSELQSRENLVCRLLLEKKNTRR